MTVQQRIDWLKGLERMYGGKYHFKGWFDAHKAVLDIAKQRGLIKPGKNWFSLVDAAILQGIQDGLRLHINPRSTSRNPAAREWKSFFDALNSGSVPSDTTLRHLWGVAEQDATNYGVRLADAEVTLHLREAPGPGIRAAFIGLGDVYRFGVKHSIFAGLPLLGDLFNPRSYGGAYFAITVALAITTSPHVIAM